MKGNHRWTQMNTDRGLESGASSSVSICVHLWFHPMVLKIEKDHQRFRQIVKGRIREDLRKFLTKGELIGKEGKHLISIPVRGVDLPHFRHGDNSQGVGAGDGKEGEAVGKGQPGKQ